MSAGRLAAVIVILVIGGSAAILGAMAPDRVRSWFGAERRTATSPTGTIRDGVVAGGPPMAAPPGAPGPSAVTGLRTPVPAPSPVAPARSPSPSAAAGPGTTPGPAGVAPGFDVVRVEPTGESVIAGRAAPGATVLLSANGTKLAEATVDASGQFAFVPPALPPGTHEITLESMTPGRASVRSEQGVTVVIADARGRPPLVTLTKPGEPAIVLSRPDAPASVAALSPPAVASASPPAVGARPVAPAAPAQAAAPLRIASVEAEGAGKLLVAGAGAPGTTVRLYLNDVFLGTGAAAADGRLVFAIERGVRPGSYRVRLDQVDPATGAVRARAEVPFNMPAVMAAAAPDAAPASRAGAPASGGLRTASTDKTAPAASAAPMPGAASPSAPAPAPMSAPRAGSTPNPMPSGSAADPAMIRAFGPAREPARVLAPETPVVGAPGAAAGTSPTVVASAPSSVDAPGTAAPAVSDPGPVVIPEINTAIVARGDNLWQISKRIYGRGLRYTVIYGANTPQLRNPNLIYPGQVLVLPSGQAGVP